jgi:hypothetical protein
MHPKNPNVAGIDETMLAHNESGVILVQPKHAFIVSNAVNNRAGYQSSGSKFDDRKGHSITVKHSDYDSSITKL